MRIGRDVVAFFKAWIERFDPYRQRRVRREQASEAFARSPEQHVGDFFALDRLQIRCKAADFFQCACECERFTGELDGRGVGQYFALARNRSLDQPAQLHANAADDHQREGDHHDTAGPSAAQVDPHSQAPP